MRTNVIAYASEWADEARKAGGSYDTVRKAVEDKALENHPVYLGMVTRITYNEKVDRYVVKYGPDDNTAKCTTDVAVFLMREVSHPSRSMRPTVYAHFNDEGAIDGALLLFLHEVTR